MTWSQKRLREVVEINPRRPRSMVLADDTVVSFVPMQAVSEEAASIEALEVRRFGDVKRGFTFFEEDDVSALFTALF